MSCITSVTLVAIAVTAMVVTSNAQIPFLGGCPEMEVVQNFNVSAYLGKWYEQQRYFAIFQLGGNCVTATYSDEGDGVVGVNNEMTNLITKRRTSIKGKATLAGHDGDAKLKVVFPSVGNFGAPYWILETDYTRYAIVWSCSGLFGANAQFAWVLTREKTPGLEVMTEIQDQLKKHNVPTAPFIKTQQICEDN